MAPALLQAPEQPFRPETTPAGHGVDKAVVFEILLVNVVAGGEVAVGTGGVILPQDFFPVLHEGRTVPDLFYPLLGQAAERLVVDVPFLPIIPAAGNMRDAHEIMRFSLRNA